MSLGAYAQSPPPGQWWHAPETAKRLELTKTEVKRLDSAFEASRLKLIKLKSRLEAEQFTLQAMMRKGNTHNKEITAQHRKLEQARTALADERFSFLVKTRNIIGNKRFQQLLDMTPTGRKRSTKRR
jgi:Spy/CpxP family protein refolding chaperone